MVPINNDYLTLTVTRPESFDDTTNRFVKAGPAVTVVLEHSLASIQRWESKWHKPYISREAKTLDEITYYMQCMVHDISDPDALTEFFKWLTPDQIHQIESFMNDSKSGHKIKENGKSKDNSVLAADYYYAVLMKLKAPIEMVEHWHINRVFALMDMFNLLMAEPKKRNKADIIKDYDRINEERLKKWNTKG